MNKAGPKIARSYRTVGRYRVYSELASGGMATVHLGCLLGPAGFSKLVAIKCLHEQFALEPDFVSMFLDEARLASTIHHPNVVASLDVVAEQGELLVVMEYVHGETLAGLLRLSRQQADAPSVSVVVRIICDALEGLHAAHTASLAGTRLNIVHRDVSPQNIMVGADGNTRVLDFGIAQAALRSQMTAAGTVKGKVAYMSPEQVQGQPVDARTDVFAAGVVLWEALAGRRLFFAPDSREAINLLLTSPIPAPSSFVPSLSPALDQVVFRALARNVEERFATAHDFAEALRDAAAEGSRREVAAWVARVAKDGLAERLEHLQALEASAIHTQVGARLPVVTASSTSHAVPTPDATITTPSGAPDRYATQATTSTSIMPQPQPPRRRRALPWLLATGGLLAALAAWVTRPIASPAGSPSAVARAPAAIPAAVFSRPSPQAAAPVAATPAARATPVEAVSPLPPLEVPASAAPPPASPAAPTSKPTLKKSAVTSQPTPAGRAKQCNPPYRIDPSGVRRVKPECL